MKNLRLLFLLIFPISLFSQTEGDWNGMLEVGAIQIPLVIHVDSEKGEIVLDSPDQMVQGKKTDSAVVSKEGLSFQIKAWGVFYNGEYDPTDNKIKGEFEQNGFKTQLVFQREKIEKKEIKRPQTPKGPEGYEEIEVSYKNKKAKLTLNGTLTIPEGEGPFPAVILASGTGQQDRNEEMVKHQPFHVIAHHLSKNGIIVLRFDDRYFGVSSSKFHNSSMEDYASDVSAGIDFLVKNKKVDKNKVGVVGHSEGGLHAPIAATMNKKIKFIVSLAGVGVDGIDLLIRQRQIVMGQEGFKRDSILIKDSLMMTKVFNQIKSPEGMDEAKCLEIVEEYLDGMSESEIEAFAESIPTIKKALPRMYSFPSIQSFLLYEPEKYWSQIDLPLLALNGSKDVQVEADQNISGFKKLNNNPKSEFVVFDGLNHLFQKCDICTISEYAAIETTIEPEVLDKVLSWIKSL